MDGFEVGQCSFDWVDEGVNQISGDDGSTENESEDEFSGSGEMAEIEKAGDNEVDSEDEVDDFAVEEQVVCEQGTRVDGLDDIGLIDWKSVTSHDVMKYDFSDRGVAFSFYNRYGRYNGFSARKSKVLKNKKGDIIQQVFVCHRQGYMDQRSQNKENRQREPKFETRCGCEAKMKVHVNGESGRWHVTYLCDDHNHDLLNEKHCRMLSTHRRMTNDDICQMINMHKVGINTPEIYKCFGYHSGGFDKIGFRKRDMYNEIGRMRRIQEPDAKAVLTYLKGLVVNDPGFFWKHGTDSEGRLENLFWADGLCRKDYELFGDVLAFDATYKKNKYRCPVVIFLGVNHHNNSIVFGCAVVANETEATCVWVLEQFLLAMKGKPPMSVMTDGDVAMRNAIKRVFPNAHHRLCAWHLQRNAYTHIHDVGFLKQFTRCMLGDYEINEFEKRWSDMVDRFELRDNEWVKGVHNKRRMWATTYLRGNFYGSFRTTSRCEGFNRQVKRFAQSRISLLDFIERFGRYLSYLRHKKDEADLASFYGEPVLQTNIPCLERFAAKVFTREVFFLFRKVLAKASLMKVVGFRETSSWSVYYVSKYRKPGKVWHVLYDSDSLIMKCSCQRMESFGLLCGHLISLLIYLDMEELPKCLVLDRWTKNAKESLNCSFNEGSKYGESTLTARFDSLLFSCREMCKLAHGGMEDYNETKELVRKQTEKLKAKNAVVNDVDDDQLQGVEFVTLRDPAQCSSKGCGKSTGTEKKKGKGRKCGNCGGNGHYRKSCVRKKHVNMTSQCHHGTNTEQEGDNDGNFPNEDCVMADAGYNFNGDM